MHLDLVDLSRGDLAQASRTIVVFISSALATDDTPPVLPGTWWHLDFACSSDLFTIVASCTTKLPFSCQMLPYNKYSGHKQALGLMVEKQIGGHLSISQARPRLETRIWRMKSSNGFGTRMRTPACTEYRVVKAPQYCAWQLAMAMLRCQQRPDQLKCESWASQHERVARGTC